MHEHCLMADILEHSAHSLLGCLLAQQQILNFAQWPILPRVDKMIPRACISVKHRRCLDGLCTIRLAAFALERVVRVAYGVFIEGEQLPERVDGEVPLCVFLLVHDGRGKSLLAGLSLENLLFDRSS